MECQAWPAAYISNRATTEKDEKPDPNLRVLEVMKSNYRPIGKTITLKWNNGLFLRVGGAAAEQTAELLFLNLLVRYSGQGRGRPPRLRHRS